MNVQGIVRGFPAEDLNDYEIKPIRNDKAIVFANPKLNDETCYSRIEKLSIGSHTSDVPNILDNVEVFVPPFPYRNAVYNYSWLGWGRLELALLAIEEGYADGFYITGALYGYDVKPVKVLDPNKAEKVKEYFIDEFGDWMDKLEEYPFKGDNIYVENPGFRRWLKRDYKKTHDGARLDDDLWDGWDKKKNDYKMRVLKRAFY